MDRTVPAGAALLLDFIRETEVGSRGRESYDVIYGHKQHKLDKPLTSMTLGEIVDAQRQWSRNHGSSAAGAYQFMRATLQGLCKELGLRGDQVLTPDLQDRLGYQLLKRRGYAAFMAGEIGVTEFGKRLAQEWASFPVLAPTKGGSRKVKRGQSYYAGDGLNKALVSPEKIEALLERVKAVKAPQEPAKDAREPVPPDNPKRPSAGLTAVVVTAVAATIAFFDKITAWVGDLPCNLFNVMCGG